jgi:hypothetical protein
MDQLIATLREGCYAIGHLLLISNTDTQKYVYVEEIHK